MSKTGLAPAAQRPTPNGPAPRRLTTRQRLPLALAATLAAGLATPGTASPPAAARPDTELRAARTLERHAARGEFPGAVLSLRPGAEAPFTVATGRAEARPGGARVDPGVPWAIGSVTKVFVAVVVLQLAQEGRLDLDAPVGPRLPGLPGVAHLTARQLLQHTSGLAEYLHTAPVEREPRRAWPARDLVAVALARGPVAAPGAGYHYANTNYLVLGELIEQVTARPWHAEVRRRLLEPLGLDQTGYAGEPSAARIGAGHLRDGGTFLDATDRWHPSLGGAAGGMYATSADLLAFTVALFEGRLLDARHAAEMRAFVPGEDQGHVAHAYGLGLERYTLNGLTLLGHMGTASAHGAFIGYDPASRTAVAVQVNAASPGTSAILAAEAVGALTGRDVAPPPAPSLSVGYTAFPFRSLERHGSGEAIGRLRVTAQHLSATWPIVANEGRTRVDLSLGYQRLQFDYRDMTHPADGAHSITATAFLRQQLSGGWGLMLVAAPGYADDFKGPASLDALTLTFVGAGSYRFSERLELGLGVGVQDAFGEPLPLPVASVDWTITDRLWLKAILPISAELTWLPVGAVGLRAALLVDGGTYHGAERIYGVANPQLKYSAAVADLGVRWFILPGLHLTVHGGHTLFRRFEFSQGRRPVPGGRYDLANGPTWGVDVGVGR